MSTTTAAGFYGTDDSTYYVTPSGKTWVVQSDDLIDCPKAVAGLPTGAVPCDDLISPPEAVAYLEAIEVEGGEELLKDSDA